MSKSVDKKHEADKVNTPPPPQHMDPSVPPNKSREAKTREDSKKTPARKKTVSSKDTKKESKREKLTPSEEL